MPNGTLSKTFDIVTVTKRQGWEQKAWKTMSEQFLLPDKWIVVYEKPIPGLPNYKWIEKVHAPESVRPSNLNASLNEGLRHVTADYVVFYQDFIDLEHDCLEKLVELADDHTFITTATINADGTDDARYTGAGTTGAATVRRVRPEQWEANVAIAPMKALRELGGFPEFYDDGWAWDNVNVAQRAAMLGYRFLIDESNRPRLLPHELTSKLRLGLNDMRNAEEIAAIRAGKRPLKYTYL